MRRLVVTALACVAVSFLAACSAHASTPSSTHAKAATTSVPMPSFTEYPALGASSTAAPYPSCSSLVANWTGANGPLWVTVQDVDGITPVTVQITETSGVTVSDSFTIPAGENSHTFIEKSVAPTDVSKVLVTTPGNDDSLGGSCWAQGGPND